ncbi:hypothetical protein PG987_007548 [Apiospora arundinis]
MQSLHGVSPSPSSPPVSMAEAEGGGVVQPLALAAPRLAVVAAELGALALGGRHASLRLQLFSALRCLLVGEPARRAAAAGGRDCAPDQHAAAAAVDVLAFEFGKRTSVIQRRRRPELS